VRPRAVTLAAGSSRRGARDAGSSRAGKSVHLKSAGPPALRRYPGVRRSPRSEIIFMAPTGPQARFPWEGDRGVGARRRRTWTLRARQLTHNEEQSSCRLRRTARSCFTPASRAAATAFNSPGQGHVYGFASIDARPRARTDASGESPDGTRDRVSLCATARLAKAAESAGDERDDSDPHEIDILARDARLKPSPGPPRTGLCSYPGMGR
jgi:hypothetical protein